MPLRAEDKIVTLLTSMPAVIEECARYLPWITVSPLISVCSYLLDGVYFGTTRTREMRNSMLIAMVLFTALPTTAWSREPPMIGTSIGQLHPDFMLQRTDGAWGRLSDFRGKKLLLIHFASW